MIFYQFTETLHYRAFPELFDGRFCSEKQIAVNMFELMLEKALQLGMFISTCYYWKRRDDKLSGKVPPLSAHLYLVVQRIALIMKNLIDGYRKSCSAIKFPFTLLEIEYIASRAFQVAYKGISARAADVKALEKCCRLMEKNRRIREKISTMLPTNMKHPFNTVTF